MRAGLRILAGVSIALLIYEAWTLVTSVLLPLLGNPHILQTDFHYYYDAALRFRDEHTMSTDSYEEFVQAMEGRPGYVLAPWCGSAECGALRDSSVRVARTDACSSTPPGGMRMGSGSLPLSNASAIAGFFSEVMRVDGLPFVRSTPSPEGPGRGWAPRGGCCAAPGRRVCAIDGS